MSKLMCGLLAIMAAVLPMACQAGVCPGDSLTVGATEVCVDIAESGEDIGRGLSGREYMAENHGMLFIFQNSFRYGFWMREMKFPLDFIWIADGHVIDLTENVPVPESEPLPMYYPSQPVIWVLEVNAGFVGQNGIRIGDRVTLERKGG
ncbi:MAG: DUF192 domain-containing protein [Chloroflexota bacterium]